MKKLFFFSLTALILCSFVFGAGVKETVSQEKASASPGEKLES